jgi:hypothetical protein
MVVPMPRVRTVIFAVLGGALTTVLVAWACVTWTREHTTALPDFSKISRAEFVRLAGSTNPHASVSLNDERFGFGWDYTFEAGRVYWTKGKADVAWAGPYWATYERTAGWPLRAVWSRVEVIDGGRYDDFNPPPANVRHRWELPWSEIIHRGLNTSDLPAFLHAEPERRWPIVPIPLGFALDTLVYSGLWLIVLVVAGRFALAMRQRGFPVLVPAREAAEATARARRRRRMHAYLRSGQPRVARPG